MWEGGPIPGELSVFPGYLMARLGDQSRRRFHKALEPVGLHPRYFGVMTVVAAQPGMSQQHLHERTGIDPSSMVAVIDDLEARGLAERRPHPEDRRARAIFLTDEGMRTLEQVRVVAAGLQRELFGALSPRELETLHQLLRKLAAAQGSNGAEPAPDGAREEPGTPEAAVTQLRSAG
jgi:DNA-binding MarR family transcriptional regulator